MSEQAGGEVMRRPTSVKRAGPYRVNSYPDGTLLVQPGWPAFKSYTPGDGGGPGILSRMELAHELELWLNEGNAHASQEVSTPARPAYLGSDS